MPTTHLILLGISTAGMVLFMVVAGWLTWESGKLRKQEKSEG